jgi:XFP N-terminal domain
MTTAHGHPSLLMPDPERLPADLPAASAPAPLSVQLLDRIDRYWRAAYYLSVGQLYLYDNPLLKRPLGAVGCQAAGGRALGHDARAELHLRAPEPGDHEI